MSLPPRLHGRQGMKHGPVIVCLPQCMQALHWQRHSRRGQRGLLPGFMLLQNCPECRKRQEKLSRGSSQVLSPCLPRTLDNPKLRRERQVLMYQDSQLVACARSDDGQFLEERVQVVKSACDAITPLGSQAILSRRSSMSILPCGLTYFSSMNTSDSVSNES